MHPPSALAPAHLLLGNGGEPRKPRPASRAPHPGQCPGCGDYPPWRTIYGFARRWAAAGILGVIRDQLRRRIRLAAGKTPQAASVIVDSQSIKASETVSKATRGWDGGKLINGRKRHLICDHRSLVLLVMVTPADAQDSLVARELLLRLALMHPEIAIIRADSGYAKNGLIP